MKLFEIADAIPTLDFNKVLKRIESKMAVYPPGSVTKRDVVQVFEFKDPSNEEVEKLVLDLDRTITKALLDFHKRNLSKLDKL